MARTHSENRFKMRMWGRLLYQIQCAFLASLADRALVLNARKRFSFPVRQQNWFCESWVKKIPYRRKGSNVNSTHIRPKRIYIGNQSETKIHRKQGFTHFAAHATTHFISYVLLKSFLHQNGRPCAKKKSNIQLSGLSSERREHLRPSRIHSWILCNCSSKTNKYVFKTKKDNKKSKVDRQS